MKSALPECLGLCLRLPPKVYYVLSPSCHFSYMSINPPMAHTHRHTHRERPPGCRGNHNAAAAVQAELLRLIRLIVEFHRMGPSLPWN